MILEEELCPMSYLRITGVSLSPRPSPSMTLPTPCPRDEQDRHQDKIHPR